MSAPAVQYWIGPAGWSYPDWDGIVYPARRPRGFHPLTFIARFFNAVEVNSSFYGIPTPQVTSQWAARVPESFRFAIKAHRVFTHEAWDATTRAAAASFCEALQPLHDARRLGPLLLQFPWSFRYTSAAADRLRRLAEFFADYRRALEVRHASWEAPEAQALLHELGAPCSIDQPALPDCIAPTARTHAGLAYVRLHGRNAATWFAQGLPSFERYNYLYDEAELEEWVERLREMGRSAGEVFLFANNHYRGQGVANALELRALLLGEQPLAPGELLRAYPRLRKRLRDESGPTLFE